MMYIISISCVRFRSTCQPVCHTVLSNTRGEERYFTDSASPRALTSKYIHTFYTTLFPKSKIMGSGRPDISKLHSLLVLNISFRTTAAELRERFETYGELGDVYVPRGNGGVSRGYAYVAHKKIKYIFVYLY